MSPPSKARQALEETRDLSEFIDIVGGSAATFRFLRHRPGDKLPATAGVFVFVRRAAGEAELVYCGETDSLVGALLLWPRAQTEFGADEVYLRLEVSRGPREAVLADIVAATSPPMNAKA